MKYFKHHRRENKPRWRNDTFGHRSAVEIEGGGRSYTPSSLCNDDISICSSPWIFLHMVKRILKKEEKGKGKIYKWAKKRSTKRNEKKLLR
jgi:hypothetical protein